MSKARKFLRWYYTYIQFASTTSSFFSIGLTLANTKHHHNIRHHPAWQYPVFAAIACLPAIVNAREAYVFQGRRIEEKEISSPKTDRHSRRLETIYLISQLIIIGGTNYFTAIALKTLILQLTGLTNTNQHFTNLSGFEYLAPISATLLLDLPFQCSNYVAETAASFYPSFHAPKDMLINKINQVYANKYTRWWVKNVGSVFHVIMHAANLLLAIPPEFILHCKKDPMRLNTFIGISAALGFLLLIPNFIQTYFLEGNVTETTLKALDPHATHAEEKPFQFKRRRVYETLYIWVWGTQAILHSFEDLMPIIQLSLKLLNGTPSKTEIIIGSAIVMAHFPGSLFGNHYGEVKDSLHDFARCKPAYQPITNTIN